MAIFLLYQDYPLAQVVDEVGGPWILEGFLKEVSFSEAVLLLPLSEKQDCEIVFPSSEVCLVYFDLTKYSSEEHSIIQRLQSITKLWVFATTEKVATPLRVVLSPLSYAIHHQTGESTLTVPMDPPLSLDEWRQLGIDYTAVVTINGKERRYIRTDADIDKVCQRLPKLSSFLLHVSRYEGDELTFQADGNRAKLFYLDIKRRKKLISINPTDQTTDRIRMQIAAFPDLELETEQRHLISREKGFEILRSFLTNGELIDMIPWPSSG